MTVDGNEAASARTLPAECLDDLVAALRGRGYRVVAPVLREGAVSYGEIESAAELPCGWTDRQEAGTYRLERDPRDLYFGFTLGAQSWKPYLFPPRLRLGTAGPVKRPFRRDDAGLASSRILPHRPLDLFADDPPNRFLVESELPDRGLIEH